jgi:hypothetical protein
MKKLFTCLAAFTLIHTTVLCGADLDALQKFPAIVGVLNMKPVTLQVSEGKDAWARVPDQLANRKAIVFKPDGGVNGVADITVVEEGWVLIAVNYDYQGNSGGDWDKEIWTARNFKSKGWSQLSSKELGGELIKTDGRAQTIFAKRLKKGTKERIRCNKYDPPFVIILDKAGKPI